MFDYAPARDFACEAQWSAVSSILEDNTWKRSAQKKLEKLSKLPKNWNSYGSVPVQKGCDRNDGKLVI